MTNTAATMEPPLNAEIEEHILETDECSNRLWAFLA
jgi:hypothetical protein